MSLPRLSIVGHQLTHHAEASATRRVCALPRRALIRPINSSSPSCYSVVLPCHIAEGHDVILLMRTLQSSALSVTRCGVPAGERHGFTHAGHQ